MERIPYITTNNVFGGMTAGAVDNVIKAGDLITRVVFAAESAMLGDTAANPKNIEGGDFGVTASEVPGAQGAKYWAAIVRIRAKLIDPDLLTDLRALDMGG